MPAKHTCDICHQPAPMNKPITLWFHTNLEDGTTHVWHMTCKMEQVEQAKQQEAMKR